MTRVHVVVVPTALEQVGRIDEWWHRERMSAPDLFLDEFGAALDRLATAPSAAAPPQPPATLPPAPAEAGERHQLTRCSATSSAPPS